MEGPSTVTYNTKYLYPGVDIKSYSLSVTNAPGTIISDTAEFNAYLNALFTPGKLLNAKEFRELTTFVSQLNTKQYKAGQLINGDVNKDTPLAYGLEISKGYFELPNGQGIIMYEHEGGTYGFFSMWEYQKDGNISFVYSVNSNAIQSARTIFALHKNLLEIISKDCLEFIK